MSKQRVFAEAAKNYNRFIIQRNYNEHDSNCPICIDSMFHRTVLHTPCKHIFHLTCLFTLFQCGENINNYKCPLCRNNLINAIISLPWLIYFT